MAFPGSYNIDYYKGDTYEFRIYPKNSDNSVFSLVSYGAIFTIATSRGANPTFAVAGTATIVGNQYIVCTIAPTVGRTLTAGTSYVYDVQISSANGSVIYTLLTGNLSVTDDVTGI
jgi:hypothetical protein